MSDDEVRDYRSLGEILRESRRKRDWTIQEVSDRTRIPPRLVRSLESDDLAQISGPIYARGFIKSLAREYALDIDWLLSKVDLEDATAKVPETVKLPDASKSVTPIVHSSPATQESAAVWKVESVRVHRVQTGNDRKIPFKPIAIAFGLVALMMVGYFALLPLAADRNGPPTTEGRPAATEARGEAGSGASGSTSESGESSEEGVVDPKTPAESEGSSETDTGADSGGSAILESDADSPGGTRAAADASPTEAERTPAVKTPATSRPANSGRDRDTVEMVRSEGPGRGLPSVVRPAPGEAVPVRLRIVATGSVEVVAAADGQGLQRRRLEPGQEWRLEGRDHFLLQASDPAALRFEVDGQPYSLPRNWSGDEMMVFRRDLLRAIGRADESPDGPGGDETP